MSLNQPWPCSHLLVFHPVTHFGGDWPLQAAHQSCGQRLTNRLHVSDTFSTHGTYKNCRTHGKNIVTTTTRNNEIKKKKTTFFRATRAISVMVEPLAANPGETLAVCLLHQQCLEISVVCQKFSRTPEVLSKPPFWNFTPSEFNESKRTELEMGQKAGVFDVSSVFSAAVAQWSSCCLWIRGLWLRLSIVALAVVHLHSWAII